MAMTKKEKAPDIEAARKMGEEGGPTASVNMDCSAGKHSSRAGFGPHGATVRRWRTRESTNSKPRCAWQQTSRTSTERERLLMRL